MDKSKIIETYQENAKDTGSAAVQIALCTSIIKELSEHVAKHKKDNSSKRGLLKAVVRRKKLSKYLSRTDNAKYKEIIEKLGLRK